MTMLAHPNHPRLISTSEGCNTLLFEKQTGEQVEITMEHIEDDGRSILAEWAGELYLITD